MGGSVSFMPANYPGMGAMPRPVGQPGIPAMRQPILTPRTQPMARPMPGRPMTDSSGRVIGGGQVPANRFMPGPLGPGVQPGNGLNPSVSIGFGMPPNISQVAQQGITGLGNLTGNILGGLTNGQFGADGAPTDVPLNPGMPMGSMGGKGGFGGPSIGFGMPPSNPGSFPSAMGMQGTPMQGGAQFTQNT